jgi:beta-lactam-binding protein with PASTA domain/serine/threonine protein kinase
MSEPDAPPSGATAPTGTADPAAAERMFAGRYRLTGRRGSGVDIALFEAADVLGDQIVAVKIIHPEICAQPGFDDRFTDMIHRVAALRHPNIARIIDIGSATWNGQQVNYAVCENLTGGSMRDLRDRGRQLSPSQVVMVGLDVCRGLDVAHRAGLVHGDIRPANLVFGDDGRLRITDLGLAELVSADIWSNPAAVSTDRARYASPEQATMQPTGPKSDVYSLCLCLLESVTGQLPFVGDSTVATLSNRVDRLMPVSADLGPLAAVFERAGRPDADGRSTAAEFGKALVHAAERLPRPQPIALLSTGLFAEAQALGSTAPDSTRVLPVTAPAAAPTVTPTTVTPDVVVPDEPAAVLTIATEISPPPPPPPAFAVPPLAVETLDTGVPTIVLAGPVGPGVTDSGVDIPPPPQPDVPLLRSSTARRRLLKFGALIVVAAALGGAVAWFLGRTESNEVPDLVGLEQGEALNMVSEFGWVITVTEEPSDDIPAGDVLRTDPAFGVSLEEDAPFSIVVSSGAAPRTLPELAGMTIEQATATLTELDLLLQQGDSVNDDLVPAGTIISWSVPDQAGLQAGDTVVPQTTVRVVVSLGAAPRVVPDLTGKTVADATAQMAGTSLVVVQGADEFSDTVPIGIIVRQDPAIGAELPMGSTVNVFVSKGSEFVTVPPLAALTPEQASQALLAAGLVLGKVDGDLAGGNILAQVNGVSIGADAVFPRGTVIDLTFGPPPTTTTVPPETVPPETVPPETTLPPA